MVYFKMSNMTYCMNMYVNFKAQFVQICSEFSLWQVHFRNAYRSTNPANSPNRWKAKMYFILFTTINILPRCMGIFVERIQFSPVICSRSRVFRLRKLLLSSRAKKLYGFSPHCSWLKIYIAADMFWYLEMNSILNFDL